MTAPLPAARVLVLAGAGNRVVAIFLDVVIVLFLGSGLRDVLPAEWASLGGWAFALLYFGGLPATRLQGTPGKALMRIKVARVDGSRLDLLRSMLRAVAMLAWVWLGGQLMQHRAVVGDTASSAAWLVFFLAWVPIGFTVRGQSLFDLVAGTVVFRAAASPEAIAAYEPLKRSVVERIAAGVYCVVAALVIVDPMTQMASIRDLRTRVEYAFEKTSPLRDKVQAFHAREGRWPSAAELGEPASNPYPAGGYYKLGGDGAVLIGFTVRPGLQGRTLTLRPNPDPQGFEWRCTADPALDKRYLPTLCR